MPEKPAVSFPLNDSTRHSNIKIPITYPLCGQMDDLVQVRSPAAVCGAATTPVDNGVAAAPVTVTLPDSAPRTSDNTGDSDPGTACHDNSQGKEEQRQKHEEGNTSNHGPGSPTSDQETSSNGQQDEDSTSVDELKKQVWELETKLHIIEEEVKNMEGQLMQKKQLIEERNKTIKEMQQKKAEMEEDVKYLRENLDREIAERENEDKNNNCMINSLKKKLNETDEEKNSLQQELRRVTFELSEETKEKEKRLKINMELRLKIDEKMQEIREKDATIKMMERQNSALENEKEIFKVRLQESQISANRFHADLEALQKQYRNTLNQLLVTSVEANNVHLVAQALENGADIQTPSGKYDRTPLHLAAARGHADVVKHLLRNGAQASSEDRCGWNAAECAAEVGHLEVLKTLYTQAPEVISHQEKLLHYTVENDHLEASGWLLAKGISFPWHKTHSYTRSKFRSVSRVFTFSWWHLFLAWWLFQTRRFGGLTLPIYMAHGLLTTLKWWWRGNNGNAKREVEDHHYVTLFMEERYHPCVAQPKVHSTGLTRPLPSMKSQQQWEQQQQLQKQEQEELQQQQQQELQQQQQQQQQELQQQELHQQAPQQQQQQKKKKNKNKNKNQLQKQQEQQLQKPKQQQGDRKPKWQQWQQPQHQASKSKNYGLPNLGNTCYMNCVLQCLYYSRPFTDHFRGSHHGKSEGDVTKAYRALCDALDTGKEIRKAAEKLKKLAGKFDSTFQGKQQQEAHDFLSFLLNWLHEELAEHTNTGHGFIDKSVVSDLFYGTHRSTITCDLRDEVINRTDELFLNLSLPVTKRGPNDLQSLLTEHFKEQNLMWECISCGIEHECVQKTAILDPPKLLIIHLSRYVEGQPNHKKLKVTYPENGLTLGGKKYQLYALCDHAGVMSFGHYTAFCRTSWEDDAAPWYSFSDISVRQTNMKEPLTCHTAHILFYKCVS